VVKSENSFFFRYRFCQENNRKSLNSDLSPGPSPHGEGRYYCKYYDYNHNIYSVGFPLLHLEKRCAEFIEVGVRGMRSEEFHSKIFLYKTEKKYSRTP
jgi:hypothetical protein